MLEIMLIVLAGWFLLAVPVSLLWLVIFLVRARDETKGTEAA